MEFEIPELVQKQLSLGRGGFELFPAGETEAEQVGYSVSVKGEPMFGFDEGDWQEGWYVIGREVLCGDPIFIDLNEPSLPVYTAPHGMGQWRETCIADSYSSFLNMVQLIEQSLSHGKIPSQQVKSIIKEFSRHNPDSSKSFWKSLIGVKR